MKYFRTELIDAFRMENNLSIRKFCEMSEISYYTYKMLMNQYSKIKAHVIINIVGTLKIKPNEFCIYK